MISATAITTHCMCSKGQRVKLDGCTLLMEGTPAAARTGRSSTKTWLGCWATSSLLSTKWSRYSSDSPSSYYSLHKC